MEGHAFSHIGRNIFNVFAVPCGKNERFNSRAISRQYFFFNAAHRQHRTAQGNFTGHGQLFFDFAVGKQRSQRREHRHSCRWPVLGCRACRYVDVDITIIEEIGIHIQFAGVCPNETQCR